MKNMERGKSKALGAVGRIRGQGHRQMTLTPGGGTPCALRLEGRLCLGVN